MKLLLIPIFFILLRIWSLLQSIVQIEAGINLNCTTLLFFVHIGVSLLFCCWVHHKKSISKLTIFMISLSLSLPPSLPLPLSQGIGDSGQGFANAILFVLFTPKVRRYFLHWVFCSPLCRRARTRSPIIINRGNSNIYYRAVQSPNSEHSGIDNYSPDVLSRNTKIYPHNFLLDHNTWPPIACMDSW